MVNGQWRRRGRWRTGRCGVCGAGRTGERGVGESGGEHVGSGSCYDEGDAGEEAALGDSGVHTTAPGSACEGAGGGKVGEDARVEPGLADTTKCGEGSGGEGVSKGSARRAVVGTLLPLNLRS
eukprot:scaffold18278_cov100-Isochrysis_galbana.AAC.1